MFVRLSKLSEIRSLTEVLANFLILRIPLFTYSEDLN